MQELLNFEQFFFVENIIKSKLEELGNWYCWKVFNDEDFYEDDF
jgi:hypothetical protein